MQSNIISDVTLGYFVETFDAATAIPAFPSANKQRITLLCLNWLFNQLSTNDYPKQPWYLECKKWQCNKCCCCSKNDSTCYGYTTPAGAAPNFVDIDYTAFLAKQLVVLFLLLAGFIHWIIWVFTGVQLIGIIRFSSFLTMRLLSKLQVLNCWLS